MTTEERLAKLETELAHAKRRNRWALGILALVAVVPALAWALGNGIPEAHAQSLLNNANDFKLMSPGVVVTQSADGKTLYLWNVAKSNKGRGNYGKLGKEDVKLDFVKSAQVP